MENFGADHNNDWLIGIPTPIVDPPDIDVDTTEFSLLSNEYFDNYFNQENYRPYVGVLNECMKVSDPISFIMVSVVRRKLMPLGQMAFIAEYDGMLISLPWHTVVEKIKRKIVTVDFMYGETYGKE